MGIMNKDKPSLIKRKHGFSLVELSILLVIFGLIAAGVLSAQALIRAAGMRALIRDFDRYNTAAIIFRDKYSFIPGDMPNATLFWGNLGSPGCVNNAGTAAVGTGTCDGNGDDKLNIATSSGGTSEEFQFWRQLALAGLIEGEYTGLSGGLSAINTIIGTNCPATRIGGGYSLRHLGPMSGNLAYWDGNYSHAIWAGTQNGIASTAQPLVTPEEMWNIDTKMDDGRPAYGKVHGDRPTSWVPGTTNCVDNNTASTANYNFAYKGVACRVIVFPGY
jgi:prepilin-type N-terminal cleavage/methylation domain-containing protein